MEMSLKEIELSTGWPDLGSLKGENSVYRILKYTGGKGEKILMEQKQEGSKSRGCLGKKEFCMDSEINKELSKIKRILSSFIF